MIDPSHDDYYLFYTDKLNVIEFMLDTVSREIEFNLISRLRDVHTQHMNNAGIINWYFDLFRIMDGTDTDNNFFLKEIECI